MRKSIFIGLSLMLFLIVSIFSVKAATQTAVDGFEWSSGGLDWGGYVGGGETYVWVYKNGACTKVTQSSINTNTKSYTTESACKSANPAVSGSTPTGSFNWTSTNFNNPATPQASGGVTPQISGSPSWGGTATPQGQGGTPGTVTPQVSSGFGGFNWSGAVTPQGQGGTPGTVTPQVSSGFGNNSLFGTGVGFGDDIQVQGNYEVSKPSFSLGGFLQGLGLLPTAKDVLTTPSSLKPPIPLEKFEVTPKEIIGGDEQTLKITWEAPNDQFSKCSPCATVKHSGTVIWDSKETLSLIGTKEIKLKYDIAETKGSELEYKKSFCIRCTPLDNSFSRTEARQEVIFKRSSGEETPPEGTIKFIASSEKVKLVNGKGTSKLNWQTSGFTSCKDTTKSRDGVTGWFVDGTKGEKTVEFTKTGTYEFSISCSKKDGTDKNASKTIIVEEDTEAPKGTLGKYRNSCHFEIVEDGYTYNIVSRNDAQKVRVKFICDGEPGKESGYDVRPIRYGLFINETIGSNIIRYECDPIPSAQANKYLATTGETIDLNCNFKDSKFDGLFDIVTDKEGKETNNNKNQKMLIAFVEWHTNQENYEYWPGKAEGTPRIDRINATRMPALEFTGSQETPKQHLSVAILPDKFDYQGGEIAITGIMRGYNKCAITSTSLNDLNITEFKKVGEIYKATGTQKIPANESDTVQYHNIDIKCDETKGTSAMVTVTPKTEKQEDPTEEPGGDKSPICGITDSNKPHKQSKPCVIKFLPNYSKINVESVEVGNAITGKLAISNCSWGNNSGKIYIENGFIKDGYKIQLPQTGKQIEKSLDLNWHINWKDIPLKTRQNIINTINKQNRNGDIDGVPVDFEFYSKQCVNDSKCTSTNSCGYSKDIMSIIFVKKQAPGSGPEKRPGDNGDEGKIEPEPTDKTLLHIYNPNTNKFRVWLTKPGETVSEPLNSQPVELVTNNYDYIGTYHIEVLLPTTNKDGQPYNPTYSKEWKVKPSNSAWIYQDVIIKKGDRKTVTIIFDQTAATNSLISIYNTEETYVIIHYTDSTTGKTNAINGGTASQSRTFSYTFLGTYKIFAYVPANKQIPKTGGWIKSNENAEYMVKSVKLEAGKNISVDIVFDNKTDGGGKIINEEAKGCSTATVADLTIDKNTIPITTINLKNINNEYSGVTKVNGYLIIDGKNVTLPEWKFNYNGVGGKYGVNQLIYPFNLDTSSAKNSLKNIDLNQVKNIQMVVNVWAYNTKQKTDVLCNKHIFTPEIEPEAAKGKVTMKCINCDKCFSNVLFHYGSLGWHEVKLEIFKPNEMNTYFVNKTTELTPGKYRIVVNSCDKNKISGAAAMSNGWTQDKVVKGFAFNNYFEVKANQTTNLGTLSLQEAANITPRVQLLNDMDHVADNTTASKVSKLRIYFTVDGSAKPNNTANILVSRDNKNYNCKLYVNNIEITVKPLKQWDRGSTKSGSVIQTEYDTAKGGKHTVFYRCFNTNDSNQVVASNIAEAVITK